MIRIFQTGDNHFGLKCDQWSNADELIESRFKSFEGMVHIAEQEACQVFVVTGDLFNSVGVAKKHIKRVVEILAGFDGSVLVLPGNHDYYDGETALWTSFTDYSTKLAGNITFLSECKCYEFDIDGETLAVFAAPCDEKHSEANRIGWIFNASAECKANYKIGVAHGAIEGVTPDMNKQYFLMTSNELEATPVNAWLVGHTHVPYPSTLSQDTFEEGYKVFNAGTHEQTHLNNGSRGFAFIIDLTSDADGVTVKAKRVQTGNVFYHDLTVECNPSSHRSLEDAIASCMKEAGVGDRSVVRLTLSGLVEAQDYDDRLSIYDRLLSNCLDYVVKDANLAICIDSKMIDDEFPEMSLGNKLLHALEDDPQELQLAYSLLKRHE